MKYKECVRCKEMINIEKKLHVTLGTHQGTEVTEMAYFHFNCWKLHFEERARLKAEAVVNGMQDRMRPIAKQLTEKLQNAISQGGDQVINLD